MNDLRFVRGMEGFRRSLNLDTPMDSTIELEILGILEFELGSNWARIRIRTCARARGGPVWSVDLVRRVRHVLRDLDGQPGNFAVKRWWRSVGCCRGNRSPHRREGGPPFHAYCSKKVQPGGLQVERSPLQMGFDRVRGIAACVRRAGRCGAYHIEWCRKLSMLIMVCRNMQIFQILFLVYSPMSGHRGTERVYVGRHYRL